MNLVGLTTNPFSETDAQQLRSPTSYWTQTRQNRHGQKEIGTSHSSRNEIQRLSERLSKVQKEVDTPIQIVGTTALSILDHIYGHRLFLPGRDFDCAFVMGKTLTNEKIQAIGKKIDALGSERHSQLIPTDRPRFPQGLPMGNGRKFTAGYGFYLEENGEVPLDISFFDHEKDIQLNGLLARDNLRIILEKNETLSAFCNKAKGLSLHELKEKGSLIDPHSIYGENGIDQAKIIRWNEIERDPLKCSMRLIRSLAKAGQLPCKKNVKNHDWKNLNQFITSGKCSDPNLMSVQLSRILMDKRASEELIALEELGIFNKWAVPLASVIREEGVEGLNHLLNDKDNHTPLDRLRSLCQMLSTSEKLTVIFDILSACDLHTLLEELFTKLIPELKKLGNHNHDYLTQLIAKLTGDANTKNRIKINLNRLVESTSLSIEEKGELVIREFLRDIPDHEKESLLQILFPTGDRAYISELAKSISRKRLGFITGVFDPMTFAHCEIVKEAINQMVLDEIYVIPVYLEGQGRCPLDWEKRQEMISLALKEIPEAKICDSSLKPHLQNGIQSALVELLGSEKSRPYSIHISGTDAYNRYKRYGLIEENIGQTFDRLFVVHRSGMRKVEIPKGYEKVISFYQPDPPIGMVGKAPMSSTMVREMVEVGNSIQHLVPASVDQYIRSNFLYKPPPPFDKPFELFADERFLHIVEKQLVVSNHTSQNVSDETGLSADSSAVMKVKEFVKTYSKQAIAIEVRYYHPENDRVLTTKELEAFNGSTLRIEVAVAYLTGRDQEPLVFVSSQKGPSERLGTGEELVKETVRQLVHTLLSHSTS